MILPRREDARHKTQMFRLLRKILQHNTLANNFMFKGGSYAALRGVLDRFSVDLDFDLPDKSRNRYFRDECHKIFSALGLEIKDESKHHLQFFLKYPAEDNGRNTLKLEINDDVSPNNKYEKVKLNEIDMYCNGHTLDTMFANKLVAAKARFDKNGKIAGRDFYDLHFFFLNGLKINTEVVEERTGKGYREYLTELVDFINNRVDERRLNEDLNPLLSHEKMVSIQDILKKELLMFINDELKRNQSTQY